MTTPDIAVLSYHGWEIDPPRLAADVTTMRERGWRDLSLGDLERLLTKGDPRGGGGRYFHVTLDDGAEGDRECVVALRDLSCPATLFVSLGTMTEAACSSHRELAASADVVVEDHSLWHNRIFHYRHIVDFYSTLAPIVTSPERLGLCDGDPVCTFGGELARPAFIIDAGVRDVCRAAAKDTSERPGSATWRDHIAGRLVASGLGFSRLGRLCAAGSYEVREAFRSRVSTSLSEGCRRLTQFLGRAPVAFAHPWWEPSPTADQTLRALGYRMTFAGRGLCRQRSPFEIPRLFVSNATPRPLDPYADAVTSGSAAMRWARDVGRKTVFR